VLAPGDVVVIPDTPPRKASVATGRRHRFNVAAAAVKLRLVLRAASTMSRCARPSARCG
jgi:hypothetical protein